MVSSPAFKLPLWLVLHTAYTIHRTLSRLWSLCVRALRWVLRLGSYFPCSPWPASTSQGLRTGPWRESAPPCHRLVTTGLLYLFVAAATRQWQRGEKEAILVHKEPGSSSRTPGSVSTELVHPASGNHEQYPTITVKQILAILESSCTPRVYYICPINHQYDQRYASVRARTNTLFKAWPSRRASPLRLRSLELNAGDSSLRSPGAASSQAKTHRISISFLSFVDF